MADIMLHTSSANQVTCIPNIFIDDFMKEANGEYVKIYLYLLRCLGRDGVGFSISDIADHLDHTEKDVMRAFTYWEKVGLLHLEYSSDGELLGICLVDLQGHDQAIAPVSAAAPKVASTTSSQSDSTDSINNLAPTPTVMKPSYSADELDAFASEEAVEMLIFAAQTYIKRPLSNKELESLLYWYDSLHMSIELIEYLIEYCVDNQHTSFHYMDSVARGWTSEGITSVEAAKASAKLHNNVVYSVCKAMGIKDRSLIDTELDYIEKWTNRLGFSVEVICEACKRTVINTNRSNFKYADSILTRWHKEGAFTLEAIASMDEAFIASSASKLQEVKTAKATVTTRGKKEMADQRSASLYEEYEKILLSK